MLNTPPAGIRSTVPEAHPRIVERNGRGAEAADENEDLINRVDRQILGITWFAELKPGSHEVPPVAGEIDVGRAVIEKDHQGTGNGSRLILCPPENVRGDACHTCSCRRWQRVAGKQGSKLVLLLSRCR